MRRASRRPSLGSGSEGMRAGSSIQAVGKVGDLEER